MLSTAEDIEVVGEANGHDRALATVSGQQPDVVLLDLEMPDGGAEETLHRMLQLPQPPSVVIVTMHDEPSLIRRFIGGGASAYLPKSASLEELLDTVRNVAANSRSTRGDGGGPRPGNSQPTSRDMLMAYRGGNWRYCSRRRAG